MEHIIGIGDYIIVSQEQSVIMTHALASCVAVTFFCPAKRIAAMIHIALPDCDAAQVRRSNPGYYASTGLPFMLSTLRSKYQCEPAQMTIRLFGGASSIRSNDFFQIGERNLHYIRSYLNQHGISFMESEVGGYVSRTIKMQADSGVIDVESQQIVV